ncbi:MAG: division/cell wall cluster transcriptional repressor MraZ [Bacilli bacterium]|nr:division/cell wall cluster transcriptional repressor MraZ [Bacilli bacterium]MBR3209440.1 division/cell wall cluster transcriptional repressor MraZ [Bacilli bacterium]
MFMGEYHQKLDDKGRLTIPSKLRYDLGEEFILTRGLDKCLFIYKKETWNKLINKYEQLPNVKEARNFMRFFLSGAVAQELDKQGRINITTPLIKYSNLDKECVIIGVGNHLEIWSKENWQNFTDENEENFSQMADNLFSETIN